MNKNKALKPNTIYIEFDHRTGLFNATGYSPVGKTMVGISTNEVQGVVHCIRSVSNSLMLLNKYKDKAIPFVKNEIDFSTFAESIGGREKLKYHFKKILPVVYI